MSSHRLRIPSELPPTREELLDLKLKVDSHKASVDLQIAEAKAQAAATGEYSDRSWFIRANHASRQYGIVSQRIQAKLSHLREQRKQSSVETRSFADHFVDVCRERLLEEFFQEIMEEAQFRVQRVERAS